MEKHTTSNVHSIVITSQSAYVTSNINTLTSKAKEQTKLKTNPTRVMIKREDQRAFEVSTKFSSSW